MSKPDSLQEFRANLVKQLARLVYRGPSTNGEKLAEIAMVKASIDAVDFIIQNDIPAPPPVDPTFMVI